MGDMGGVYAQLVAGEGQGGEEERGDDPPDANTSAIPLRSIRGRVQNSGRRNRSR